MQKNISHIALIFLVFSIFILNITTATRYPAPWTDEVLYIDPAINLAEGNGFTSTAWPSQSKEEFWASNSPLYSLLQAGWIKVFGSELIVTRALSYIFGFIAVILISVGLKNFNLVRSEILRKFSIVFLLTLFPIAYAYRIGRPDVVCLFLSSSVFAAASFSVSKIRDTLLVVSSMLTPFANLSVIFFIATIIGVGLLFFRKRILRDAILIMVGMSLGILFMLAFYWFNDSLRQFLTITVGSGHTLLGQIAQYVIFDDNRVLEKLKDFPIAYFQSFFSWPYTTYLLVCAYLILLLPRINRNRINFFFSVSVLCIPLFLLLAGKYTWHMSWMHISVLTVAIFYSIDRLDWQKNAMICRSSAIPLILCVLIGFPWMMGVAFSEWDERSRVKIENFSEKHITSSDTVVVDFYVYLEARKRTKSLFVTSYGGGHGLPEIPPEQTRLVNKMIIKEDDFDRMQSKYGGQWEVTDQFSLPIKDYGLFNHRFGDFRVWDSLVVYERDE